MDMEFLAYNISLAPVIILLVALAVQIGLNKKYAPILAVVMGIIVGVFYLSGGDLKKGVLIGIVLGLSASGLYSSTKKVTSPAEPNALDLASVDSCGTCKYWEPTEPVEPTVPPDEEVPKEPV